VLQTLTFWLIIVGVLTGYLFASVALRLRKALRDREKKFTGKAFDVSTIAPQIERVREDYVARVAHSHSASVSYRTRMFRAAQRLISSLSYFRHSEKGHKIQPDLHPNHVGKML
jgi:uncharacterized membrane protein YgaE (UPF0421/DUF939 family)